MKKRYNEILDSIEPEKADSITALDAINVTLVNIRKSTHCQGKLVRKEIEKRLDDLNQVMNRCKE